VIPGNTDGGGEPEREGNGPENGSLSSQTPLRGVAFSPTRWLWGMAFSPLRSKEIGLFVPTSPHPSFVEGFQGSHFPAPPTCPGHGLSMFLQLGMMPPSAGPLQSPTCSHRCLLPAELSARGSWAALQPHQCLACALGQRGSKLFLIIKGQGANILDFATRSSLLQFQLTFEQHRLEPRRSTYTEIFFIFYKGIRHCKCVISSL